MPCGYCGDQWPKPRDPRTELRRCGCGGQRHGGFAGQQKKGETLLQIGPNRGIGMAQITNGNVLANMQVEISAAGGENKGAADRRGPNDLAVNDPPKVLQYRVPVVS